MGFCPGQSSLITKILQQRTHKNNDEYMLLYIDWKKKPEVTAEGPNVIPCNWIKIHMPDHIIMCESHISINM
jgi:hypothetical protein